MASKKPNGARVSGVKAFFEHEAAGGIVLLAAALLGLILMNSPAGSLYEHLLETHVPLGVAPLVLDKSLLHWINDGLMAIFFFLVGLEIKRELVVGELSTAQAGGAAGHRRGRRHARPGADLRRHQLGRSDRLARLGHSGRHRHRLRRRRAGPAGRPHPGAAEDLPAGARHHRRSRRHHHHRRSSTRHRCRTSRLASPPSASPRWRCSTVAASPPSGPTCWSACSSGCA